MRELIILFIVIIFFGGWCANVYKAVTECDFDSPYKCEAIRGVGLFVPFVGAVVGYIDIKDE